ncbi:MAG TPA: glycerophosphodiester phosphodiesterase [Terriglobales bacterium]|nr:glycerophosphodiester phosphodiesterase [Terriglobales bacterium]
MPDSHRPLLLGHRGARVTGIPENTFAAFDHALQKGCDGFEFDVRCTRDGRLIICHDPQLMGRMVTTTPYVEFEKSAPCLEQVLERYSDAFLDIELKLPGMANAVTTALKQNPPRRGFVVSSFLPQALLELQSAGIPLGFICDKKEELARWPTLPVQFVIPHYKLLSQKLLEELHAAGKKVFVWTVNDPREMKRFSGFGVDAIISDNPDLLAGQISS